MMEWKALFKVDKTRVLLYVASIPVSAFISVIFFLIFGSSLKPHVFFPLFGVSILALSYVIAYIADIIRANLVQHKVIYFILVAIFTFFSLIGLLFVMSLFMGGQVEKPAVYLYPLEDSQVHVTVDINGAMTEDIPAYGNGWNVFVTKDGIIDGKYDYLFYEAWLNRIQVPDEGWVVEYGGLASWFDTNLPELGLNDKEIMQFKEYWLQNLPEAEYYEIRLFSDDFLDKHMALNIVPEPDTIIRRDFYFKALDAPRAIEEPDIHTPARDGFVVVEWGGILA